MAHYLTTVQITPPATLPITVEQARQNSRISTTWDDNLLTTIFIPSAVDLCERYLNRALITRTLMMTIVDVVPKSDWPIVGVPYTVLPLAIEYAIAHQQRSSIPLLYSPVSNVVSAQYGIYGQADTTLVYGTDYEVDLLSEPARVHFELTVPWYQTDHISVTYEAGYGATPESIPPAILNAILVMTTHLYNNRGGASVDIPEAVYDLLSPYRLITFAETT